MLSIILIILIFIFLFFLLFLKEPVYSIFCFIIIVCSIVGLMFFLNIEYIALTFLLIYIGAIVVLFIFVTMLLNIRVNAASKLSGYTNSVNLIVYGTILTLILLKLVSFFIGDFELEAEIVFEGLGLIKDPLCTLDTINLISIFSIWLYSFYAPLLIITSFILLIALVGSILVTSL
jgi:NADH-quinone oxidoreductase subunit J